MLSQHCMATVTTYGARKSRTCASLQTDPETYLTQKPTLPMVHTLNCKSQRVSHQLRKECSSCLTLHMGLGEKTASLFRNPGTPTYKSKTRWLDARQLQNVSMTGYNPPLCWVSELLCAACAMVNVNLPVELGAHITAFSAKSCSINHVSSLPVLYVMTPRPLFAASWWNCHFVCTVSSESFTKTVKMSKKKLPVPVHPILYADCSFLRYTLHKTAHKHCFQVRKHTITRKNELKALWQGLQSTVHADKTGNKIDTKHYVKQLTECSQSLFY